jgi:hypothetical protein
VSPPSAFQFDADQEIIAARPQHRINDAGRPARIAPHYVVCEFPMSASSDFRLPIVEEMRELWRKYRDPDVRRLLLEIHHLRRVLVEADKLRESIDRVWNDDVGGQLVALYRLRCRL